jgi:hypothetical protein
VLLSSVVIVGTACRPARARLKVGRRWVDLPEVTSAACRLPARVALGLALLLIGLAQAGPAAAATVTPTAVKSFGIGIDAFPRWERESGCSPTEKPGPRYVRRLLVATYGPLSSNIVRPCTAADSGHEEGRALDWMTNVRVPEQKAMADAFVAWLQAPDGFGNPEAMARRLGISYLIWNNQTWRAYDPGRGWTEYNGCLAPKKHKKKFDNFCHRTHVHLSFTWDGALKRTSFYSGLVACPAPVAAVPPVLPVPAVTTAPTTAPVPPVAPVLGPVQPLTAARLLGTKKGIGTPGGPCRVHPDVRLDLPVLGLGGVPSTGVAAVVLRVRLVHPDAAGTLRVWPAGAPMPVESLPLDATGRAAEVTVPVGTAGSVSLQLSGAMAHLRADVTGWVAAAPV